MSDISDAGGYIMVRIPRGMQPLVSACKEIAKRLNLIDGNKNSSRAAEDIDAFERIFGEWISENRPYYWSIVNDSIQDDDLRRARFITLERDGYNCVICHKSEINLTPSIEIHHIIPRSHAQLAAKICGKLHTHRNLVSLCHEHHERVTNPTDSSWHWRAIAPRLFELIGEPDLAIAMGNHKGDG